MKVYVVGSEKHYANFLNNVELVDNLEEANVVLFTGGEDVTPSLYGCKAHPSTYFNIDRDLHEKAIFEQVRSDQVCYGCCRGSQFIAVMNGALLVQNIHNHAIGRTHAITDGEHLYQITSTHHQMQYPYNLNQEDYDLLYRSYDWLSDYYEGDKIDYHLINDFGEPEIVLYHKKNLPRCLAVQGHPEMIPNSPVAKMISNLIDDLVYGNI